MMHSEERVVPEQQPKQKRGLMSRLLSPRRKSVTKSDKREGTPSPSPPGVIEFGREPMVVTPSSGDYSSRPKQRKSRVPDVREVTLEHAPTAREAAFGGPPRYDWIDIVRSRTELAFFLSTWRACACIMGLRRNGSPWSSSDRWRDRPVRFS